jgi:hypothetical protein
MGIRATITILLLVCTTAAFAGSPKSPLGKQPTIAQKKELAKELGIILKGITKREVRDTFGLLVPELWYTPEGQEVWYYKSPEPQNIYFTDDKVEWVEYFPEKEGQPVKQEEEI